MRRAIAAVLIAGTAPAAADSLTPDPDADIAEVSHEITARFPAADLVELTVRRSFANRGDAAAGLALEVELPEGAVVTGMRSRSGAVWHKAALLGASIARQRFESQLARVGVPDQDPVLLAYAGAGRASIHAEVPARGTLAIEYTVRAPATRENGRLRALVHHEPGDGLVAPVIRVEPPAGGAWINGAAVIAGAPRVMAAPPPSAGPSSVSSLLALPGTLVVRSAVARAFISHPSPSDLVVDVVSDDGQRQRLVARSPAALDRLRAGVALAPKMVGTLGSTWKLVVTDQSTNDTGVLHSWRLDVVDRAGKRSVHRVRAPVAIPDAVADAVPRGVTAVIEVARDPGALAIRHGRALFAGGASSVTRLHIDAPDAFSPEPEGLRVVFVLDASRSLSAADIEAQLDIAAAYLAAAPKARFELVRFDRRARRLLGRFAPASEMKRLRAELAKRGAFATANGSHLERGLELAARALRAARPETSRIVILSDGLMRSRFTNAAARRAIRRGPRPTIAHLVIARDLTGGADERIDGHPLAPIAAATGGMAIAVDSTAADLARSALHLVRPIRVDHFAVSAPFVEEARSAGALYEGSGVRFASVLDQASPPAITVRGKLWARSIDRVVPATRAAGDLAAALVFGDRGYIGLPASEIEALAMRGHAVSPATSLLTVRPGDRGEVGLHGWGIAGTCSSCSFGSLRGSGVGGVRRPITLRGPLASCAEKLGPAADLEASVRLETSLIEIVDVEVTAADPKVRACLTEAIWAHRLGFDQAGGELETHAIALSRSQLRGGSRP